MTTHTEVNPSTLPVQSPMQIKTPIWTWVLVALLFGSLIGAALFVLPQQAREVPSNQRALAAWTARYQGLANAYTAQNAPVSARSLAAWTARYQGLANAYAAQNVPTRANLQRSSPR